MGAAVRDPAARTNRRGPPRYDEGDVARVEWLRARLREGYRIREAASLLGAADGRHARCCAAEQLQAILATVEDGAHEQVGPLVDQSFAVYGVDATFEEILAPLLRTVGERRHDRALTVGDEHIVSEAVRSRLGHLLAGGPGGVRGRIVLACAPGERHELGLMMVGIRLRREGWDVRFLGADTPFEDALAVAARLSARLLGISVTTAERADALAPPEGSAVPIVVGGQAATPALAQRLGASHADAAAALRRYAA